MIILEGADCLGKTTAAEALCKRMASEFGGGDSAYYRHMTKPPDTIDHVAHYFNGVGCHVQDRYHLGSVTYGRIIGGGSFTTPRRMRVVQQYLRWMGCVTVIFVASRQFLADQLKRAGSRKEMYSRANILDVNEAYWGLANSSNNGVQWCDYLIDVTHGWASQQRLDEIFDAWLRGWM